MIVYEMIHIHNEIIELIHDKCDIDTRMSLQKVFSELRHRRCKLKIPNLYFAPRWIAWRPPREGHMNVNLQVVIGTKQAYLIAYDFFGSNRYEYDTKTTSSLGLTFFYFGEGYRTIPQVDMKKVFGIMHAKFCTSDSCSCCRHLSEAGVTSDTILM
jgi:hypothetical protein